ncbi:MAG TPA: AAA family ATPase [Candidatus Babeliaceae bacterium]|nr:AAA family ATPase [Candidatus Babeliaceae bacterium]
MYFRGWFALVLTVILGLSTTISQSDIGDFFKIWSEINEQNRRLVSTAFNQNPSLHDNGDQLSTYTFNQLAGRLPEKVHELVNIINQPEKYKRFGQICPKGVLLYGPPGNGKTSIARAIAGEIKAPFFSISGTEFVQIFVGKGPIEVRNFFQKAYDAISINNYQHAVLFIDEIDAVGGKRDTLFDDIERRRTLNQILKEMDGFDRHPNIIVIAATNTVEYLDPALLRPGRFDWLIEIPSPDKESRIAILNLYLNNLEHRLSQETVAELAEQTAGFTGAELEGLIKEASLLAVREDSLAITADHIGKALSSLKKVQRLRR